MKIEKTPPLMYNGFLFKDGIYTNLQTSISINIKVNKANLTSILKLIDNIK